MSVLASSANLEPPSYSTGDPVRSKQMNLSRRTEGVSAPPLPTIVVGGRFSIPKRSTDFRTLSKSYETSSPLEIRTTKTSSASPLGLSGSGSTGGGVGKIIGKLYTIKGTTNYVHKYPVSVTTHKSVSKAISDIDASNSLQTIDGTNSSKEANCGNPIWPPAKSIYSVDRKSENNELSKSVTDKESMKVNHNNVQLKSLPATVATVTLNDQFTSSSENTSWKTKARAEGEKNNLLDQSINRTTIANKPVDIGPVNLGLESSDGVSHRPGVLPAGTDKDLSNTELILQHALPASGFTVESGEDIVKIDKTEIRDDSDLNNKMPKSFILHMESVSGTRRTNEPKTRAVSASSSPFIADATAASLSSSARTHAKLSNADTGTSAVLGVERTKIKMEPDDEGRRNKWSQSGEYIDVELHKGPTGLGFCIEGGIGSPAGDNPITVKRLYNGMSRDRYVWV